jgi:UDP-N-acetylglucosamine 2-epimerase (non-hydrolysing)
MNIPCITLRDSTERPETVTLGTNEVIGFKPDALGKWLTKLKNGDWKQTKIPLLWDGKTSQRIVDILLSMY